MCALAECVDDTSPRPPAISVYFVFFFHLSFYFVNLNGTWKTQPDSNQGRNKAMKFREFNQVKC
jgi:hypothetical protein